MEEDYTFQCPYCGEQISMIFDLSITSGQKYTEDCEVCCRPIEIFYKSNGDKVSEFYAQRS